MKIERLQFEKKMIEIKETYIDMDGKVKERTRKVFVPTGKCLNADFSNYETLED